MIALFSPAKINLFLHVLEKQTDNYHALSSMLQTVGLGDILEVQLHDENVLSCTDPSLSLDASNLIVRAVNLFKEKTKCTQCFKIHLHKKIPVQAGLGGGSSNAATTLWACNTLTQSQIPLSTLQQWGAELGSDVPFFLSEGTAYCTGRGEVVHPLQSKKRIPLSIIKPAYGVSTPAVYQKVSLSNTNHSNCSSYGMRVFLKEWMVHKDFSQLGNCLSGSLAYVNDLEVAAFTVQPKLKQLKAQLLKGGFDTVLLAGSGSSFFCLGNGIIPSDPSLTAFSTTFIHRTSSNWYPLSEEPL